MKFSTVVGYAGALIMGVSCGILLALQWAKMQNQTNSGLKSAAAPLSLSSGNAAGAIESGYITEPFSLRKEKAKSLSHEGEGWGRDTVSEEEVKPTHMLTKLRGEEYKKVTEGPDKKKEIKKKEEPAVLEEQKLAKAVEKESSSVNSNSVDGCPHDFKVYVYELPSNLASVRLAEEARTNKTLHVCQKCILEQFALEYVNMGYVGVMLYV